MNALQEVVTINALYPHLQTLPSHSHDRKLLLIHSYHTASNGRKEAISYSQVLYK